MGVKNKAWAGLLAVSLLPATPAFALGFAGFGDLWIVSVFRKGGPMMWPILLCSIIAVAIALERLGNLRRRKVINPKYLREVRALWLDHEFSAALKLCLRHTSSMSRIVRAGLIRSHMGVLEVERAVESAGSHESTLLTANLRGLGVIANLAPMLGLLGTVAGMIRAFNVISTSGTGNPSLVASGISEALITTAAGLIVGIPTLAAYHFFRGRADKLIFEMEEISISFMEEISYALHKKDEEAGDAVHKEG
jgi:biopolymer transport protein ExbB